MKSEMLSVVLTGLVSTAVYAQQPPEAILLEGVMKRSDHILLGTLSSARTDSRGVITYNLAAGVLITGEMPPASCLTSKISYPIGVELLFFLTKKSAECMDGGVSLRRAFELKELASVRYVVFSDERYIYPDLSDRFTTVQSIPWNSDKAIPLWTGVPLDDFKAYVRNLKNL